MNRKHCLFLLLMPLLLACSHEEEELPSGDRQKITAGNWKVGLFTDSGNDETQDFTGYTFHFLEDGSMHAENSSGHRSGSWILTASSTQLIINLGPKIDTNHPLGQLTDDWYIISISDQEIKLKDDHSVQAEMLTFTRI